MVISLLMTLLLVGDFVRNSVKEIYKDLVHYTFIDHRKVSTSSLKSVSHLESIYRPRFKQSYKEQKEKKKNQDRLFKLALSQTYFHRRIKHWIRFFLIKEQKRL